MTLITANAEGIEGGKEAPGRSRWRVDVGVVESATLADDLTHVEIKARLNSGMEKLLHKDTVFWVVKPQVGREGSRPGNAAVWSLYRTAARRERQQNG